MKEIGEYLRREREKRQISLRKVADETKIPIRYLEAIEQGQVEIIPGEVYLKGFLRSYAQEIGLDGEEVLERYRQLNKQDEDKEQELRQRVERGGNQRNGKKVSWHLRYERAFVAVLLLVLLIVAIVAAFRSRGIDKPQEQPQPKARQELPKAAPKEEVAPEPAPQVVAGDVEIFARDNCWVEAYSGGSRVFAIMMNPGETKKVPVQENVALLLGKPAVVRLKYGEEEVQGLGKETVTVVFDREGNYNIYRGRRQEEFSR